MLLRKKKSGNLSPDALSEWQNGRCAPPTPHRHHTARRHHSVAHNSSDYRRAITLHHLRRIRSSQLAGSRQLAAAAASKAIEQASNGPSLAIGVTTRAALHTNTRRAPLPCLEQARHNQSSVAETRTLTVLQVSLRTLASPRSRLVPLALGTTVGALHSDCCITAN